MSNKDLCPGVNVRGDNGYVILPAPGNGYGVGVVAVAG